MLQRTRRMGADTARRTDVFTRGSPMRHPSIGDGIEPKSARLPIMGGNNPGRGGRICYHVELNNQLQVLLLPVFRRVAKSSSEKLRVGDQSRGPFRAVLHATADQDQHSMRFWIERP